MKKLIAIFLFLGLVSCTKNVSKTEINKEKVSETKVWVSKNQKFLDKFKTIDFDTLKVYSSDNVYDDKNFEYRGNLLDSIDAKIFPKNVIVNDIDKIDTYAVYKFKIDENYLALIARTPSEYWSSSIKLFIYNKKNEKIIDFVEVAESIGDEGFHMDISSWILKKKNVFEIINWIYEYDDYSVEGKNDKRIIKTNTYFLLKFENGKFDTISKNNKELEKQFSKLLRKK